MLAHVGFPPSALNLVRSLYFKHTGRPVIAGHGGEEFPLSAGIRQGCPLSPLLYVVAADGILRRMRQASPLTTTRAYADDTAAVLVDLAREAPAISNVFAALATASGLHLNVSKCLCIPLHLRPQATVAEELAAAVPAWGHEHSHLRYLPGLRSRPGQVEPILGSGSHKSDGPGPPVGMGAVGAVLCNASLEYLYYFQSDFCRTARATAAGRS